MRLIDADALSEKLCKTTIFVKDGEVFQRMVNDAPTVSAKAVQGEWVWSDEDASWMCGACCCVFREIDWKPNYNFCPNCGAKMRGEENEIN